jgi:zinc-binding alcohol dehydrogenase family protein
MKAIGYQQCLPVTDPACLIEFECPEPVAQGHDLKVRIHAVSVNPVDTKVRRGAPVPAGQWRVLGYDAAGVVESVGEKVTRFRPGDRVYYAGSRARPGTNAQWHLVDERIVGHMPRRLGFAQAAALPLTTITAWEALFDRLQLPRKDDPQAASAGTVLITAAAGGVGSIAVQLARQLTHAQVLATASRPESQAQARALGAHQVLDHSQPLSEALKATGLPWVERIFSISHTHRHYAEMCRIIAPQGRLCMIDDPPEPIDVRPLKARCASLHWEAMFTRSGFETPDMIEQGRLLDQTAALIDDGVLQSTHASTLGPIDAKTLRRAHEIIETGQTIGKIVLEGF